MLKPDSESVSQEKYDNYLTKLQNICTDQAGEETGAASNKPVYESMKTLHSSVPPLPAQT